MEKRTTLLGLLIASLAAGGATGCTKPRADPAGEAAEPEKEPFGKLTVDELSARMEDAKAGKIKLAIYDNNQRERFTKSHIAGARWVDFKHVTAGDLPADRDTELVFYCSHEL